MKVRCIDTDQWDFIRFNRIYQVEKIYDNNYHIRTNYGVFSYPKYLFEVIEDEIQENDNVEILEMSDLDSKIKELQEQLDILMKAKEIMEK